MTTGNIKFMSGIHIEQTEGGTIYSAKGIKFRIAQVADSEFIIQKLIKKPETNGFLWWKKSSVLNEWKCVDMNGTELYVNRFINNLNKFRTYKSFDTAKKWIEDYAKYPIYL